MTTASTTAGASQPNQQPRAYGLWRRYGPSAARRIAGAERKMHQSMGLFLAALWQVAKQQDDAEEAAARATAANETLEASRSHQGSTKHRDLGHLGYALGVAIIGVGIVLVDRVVFLFLLMPYWETVAFAALIAIADIVASHWVGEEARQIADAPVPAFNLGNFLIGRMAAGLIIGIGTVLTVGLIRGAQAGFWYGLLWALISLSLFLSLCAMAYAHSYKELDASEAAKKERDKAKTREGLAVKKALKTAGSYLGDERGWRTAAGVGVNSWDRLALECAASDHRIGITRATPIKEPPEVEEWRAIADGTTAGPCPDAHKVNSLIRRPSSSASDTSPRALPPAA